ncbi:MAG: LysR family transcriptional regulator [Photobacterium frigidiphilum]|uniref:LysR family transcriptional regulator n=1 Tax=Photobacterium frigidiphilum TaxID=264736 RepID=UPI00300394EB
MSAIKDISQRISLKMLRYFYAVAQERHFARAAQKLNISSSPLSAQIKELESLIGSPLFIRSTRTVELTSIGQLLFEECHSIFRVIDSSISKVVSASRTQQETLNVGLISSFFWAGLGEVLRSFKDIFPKYDFKIFEMTPEMQKEALDKKVIDIGLSRFADTINIAPFISEQLMEDPMIVVVSSQHKFKDRKLVSIEELVSEEFVFMQRQDSASSKLILDTFLVHGHHINVGQEVFEPNTLMSIVATSSMISIVPTSFSFHKWSNVHFIRLKENIPAHLCALYDYNNSNPVLDAFITHTKHRLNLP